MTTAAEHVKSVIASILESRLATAANPAAQLSDDFDLRDEGIVDSLGFVQLIAELEMRLGTGIDVGDLDPEKLTNVGALSRHIAQYIVAYDASRTDSIS